jgi:Ca-activated chloride channel family protein
MTRGLMIFALAAAALTPLQQQPTFRGGVQTVPVFVTVRDTDGTFAVNLTRDDFEVRDNGKVQTITQFTTATQALSSVLLLDGSSSMWSVFDTLMESANSFILRMLPDDRTAIASFADRFQMRQPFTSDRDELLRHLKDPFNVRTGLETHLWEGLQEAVLAVRKEKNRRVIVVLSDGKNWIAGAASSPPSMTPRVMPGPSGRRGQPQSVPMTVPSAAGGTQAVNVTAHAMDDDVMVYAIAMWTFTDKQEEKPDRSLMKLAEETGGGYYELRLNDDVNATFTQIATELHQQYLLGFTPAALDGKVHKLDVKVKKPGMLVRARRSYLASASASGESGGDEVAPNGKEK